jgi:hypothetical protein
MASLLPFMVRIATLSLRARMIAATALDGLRMVE